RPQPADALRPASTRDDALRAAAVLRRLAADVLTLCVVAGARSSRRASREDAPHEQDDERAHRCSNHTGRLIPPEPADGLPEISRDERDRDSKQRRQDEARGLVRRGMNELGKNAGDKADHNGPKNAHGAFLLSAACSSIPRRTPQLIAY